MPVFPGQPVEQPGTFPGEPVETTQQQIDEYAPIPGAQVPELTAPPEVGAGEGVARGVAEGASLGFSDELTGIAARILGVTPEEAEVIRQNSVRRTESAPTGARIAGNLIGGVGAGLALPAAVTAAGGPTLAGQTAASAGLGAAIGSAAGAGSAEPGERLEGAGEGALIGSVTGAVAPAVGRGIGRLANVRHDRAPSVQALRDTADDLFAQADNSGVIISRAPFEQAAQRIQGRLAEEGIDATMHPNTMAAFNRLAGALDEGADSITLRGAETIRRVINEALKSPSPQDRRMAGILRDGYDDFLNGLRARDVIAGNPGQAMQATRQARSLWSRMRKGEFIEDLFTRARENAPNFSGSGMENAIRSEFRRVARNTREMRRFNAVEKAAIRKVARGGPVTNILRMAGKFAPTGVVSTVMSGGAGAAIGGPVGAVALPAAGFAARQGATAGTRGAANTARDIMLRGRPQAVRPAAQEADELTRLLLRGSTPAAVNKLR